MINVDRIKVWQRAQTDSVRRAYLLPALVLLIGLLMPLFFAEPDLALRNEDSFEYITGSQTILQSRQYLAMSGRSQTVFPPGYSLAIVPFAVFFEPVQAAKIVSWLASGVSVLLLFIIARDWFGARIAVLSALLFAALPLRVWLAQAAQSESLYVMLLLVAVAITVRTPLSRVWPAAAVGAILGWAYLTRPEAIILLGIIALSLLVTFIRDRKNAKPLFIYLAAFLVVALPYVLWLSVHSGRFVLTGKGRGEIGRGIAREAGKPDVLMRRLSADDSAIAIATTSPALKEIISHAGRNLESLKRQVLTNSGVQPIAGALILIGLLEICRRIFQRGLWQFGLLQLFFALHLILYAPFWIEQRLIYAGSVALCIWLAVGADTISGLMTRESESKRLRTFATITVGILTVAVFASYLVKLRATDIRSEKTEASRQIAQVIAARPDLRGSGVIGEYPGAGFFAGTRHEWMPYCELNQLRRFAAINRAELVAFSDRDTMTPATEKLIKGEYAANEAELVKTVPFGNENLYLFRLMPPGLASSQTYR